MANFNNPHGVRYGATPLLLNSEFGRRFVLRSVVRAGTPADPTAPASDSVRDVASGLTGSRRAHPFSG
jgi:hypothetical protein